MSVSQKTGRPLSDNPKSEVIRMRVTPEEKACIMQFSHDSGYGLLELLKIGIETVQKK